MLDSSARSALEPDGTRRRSLVRPRMFSSILVSSAMGDFMWLFRWGALDDLIASLALPEN